MKKSILPLALCTTCTVKHWNPPEHWRLLQQEQQLGPTGLRPPPRHAVHAAFPLEFPIHPLPLKLPVLLPLELPVCPFTRRTIQVDP